MQTHYMAQARGTPRGGLVLLHEAFGLTPHIRGQVSMFANLGYTTFAPDMLAAQAPTPESRPTTDDTAWETDGTFTWLRQNKAGLDTGRDLIIATKLEQLAPILTNAIATLKKLNLPVATIGYCWGGSVSFMAAKQLPGLACAVCYYGGRIAEIAAQPPAPKVPVLAHLAKLDRYIPFAEAIAALHTHAPEVEAYAYDADHGFNREDGPTYDEQVAYLARTRTLAFFDKHLK